MFFFLFVGNRETKIQKLFTQHIGQFVTEQNNKISV